jgi:hypothetical protein
MAPLGAEQQEIKLEAGAHMVQLGEGPAHALQARRLLGALCLSLSVCLSLFSPVPRPNPSPPAQHASEPTLPRVGMHAGSGDLPHFYAAATPGWVPNGNYTAGYIILDKDEPTKIIQRGSGQFMIPTFEYETLCDGKAGCAYGGERRNVIFLCSATKIGPDKFRLFFGGGDGNVGTGVVQVSAL